MDYAFLVLKEHPYGQEMLRILLERGLPPRWVVEEESSVADEERHKFVQRIAGQALPPTIRSLLGDLDVAHHEVDNHNRPTCLALLDNWRPDLLVLGGTRILRPALLAVAPHGTVNAHPSLLPRLRGSASVAWALYYDLPIGCTTHLVDAGIDTGPILMQRQMPVYRGDSYEQIVRRSLTLAGELMAETVQGLAAGRLQPVAQDPAGEALRVIPLELLAEARARLADGRYSHYAPSSPGPAWP